jgi:hypothetical protein
MTTSRVLLSRMRVQDVIQISDATASLLRWSSRLPENPDTLARGRALAYRWSAIPGCSCLHRAVATNVWLSAFGMPTRIMLGLRKREELEGHAWLEVYLGDAATLLFVDDEDGYDADISLPVQRL